MAKEINTEFVNVIEFIQETYNLSYSKIANALNANGCYSITPAKINQYMSLFIRNIPDEVITALHKLYNINPDYLRGESDVMLDSAKIYLESMEKIVKTWSTAERHYIDETNGPSVDRYLHITMDSDFYHFLVETDKAKMLQEMGMKSFDEEFQKCRENYNEKREKEFKEYVLIPRSEFFKMTDSLAVFRPAFRELVNLDEHIHYPECVSTIEEAEEEM